MKINTENAKLSEKITSENAKHWHDKRLADADTARARGMFEIEREWREDATRIAAHFAL